jgi:hypothetical protein
MPQGNQDFQTLLAEACAILGTPPEPCDDGRTQCLEFSYSDGHTQRAFITLIEGNERFQAYFPELPLMVHVYSRIGPFSSVVDPHDLLRRSAAMIFSRVILERNDSPPSLLVEACHSLQGLPPATLAAMLQETADFAETFEDEIFGVDQE